MFVAVLTNLLALLGEVLVKARDELTWNEPFVLHVFQEEALLNSLVLWEDLPESLVDVFACLWGLRFRCEIQLGIGQITHRLRDREDTFNVGEI